MEEVLVVGEPGADSDDGGREQAGRVRRWEAKNTIRSRFSDPTLQRRCKLHVGGGSCNERRV